jgi:hypothetical protein
MVSPGAHRGEVPLDMARPRDRRNHRLVRKEADILALEHRAPVVRYYVALHPENSPHRSQRPSLIEFCSLSCHALPAFVHRKLQVLLRAFLSESQPMSVIVLKSHHSDTLPHPF